MKLRVPPDDKFDFELSGLGFDAFETGLLAVARYFFLTHAQPECQAWETGFAVAVERWGPEIGLAGGPFSIKTGSCRIHLTRRF